MDQTNDGTIESLRMHIDRIDEQLHDLLMARSALVERIGTLKSEGDIVMRPGREAEILRRLTDRHLGSFPKAALVRIWREIIGALTHLQRPLTIAVVQDGKNGGLAELARDHFGTVPTLRPIATAGQVVKMVADAQVSLGVVPMPGVGTGGGEQWWAALIAENAPRIVSRLPFYPYERGETAEALVVARRPHDGTGHDRTFLVMETDAAVSRDRARALVAKAKFEPTSLPASMRVGETQLHLVEVEGWVSPNDPRLVTVVREPVRHAAIVGGYPVPLVP